MEGAGSQWIMATMVSEEKKRCELGRLSDISFAVVAEPEDSSITVIGHG
jgi:hypothetical protein